MSQLSQQFANDHRDMTQLLRRLQVALENKDDREAARLADELDLIAGPHIQFEETTLYPELGRTMGRDFENLLRSEHQQPLAAIRFLRGQREQLQLTNEERTNLISQVQAGLAHAEVCGRLMSHVSTLSPDQEEKFLNALYDMKRAGSRWTEVGEPAN